MENVSVIDWESNENIVLINPRLPEGEKNSLLAILQEHPITNHFWVATSGSSGRIKWTALSKDAVLASAAAVNSHLESSSRDVWLHTLPDFHVGGLGIYARAYLTGSLVKKIDKGWNAETFIQALFEHKATLTSLVPAQVYDLVQRKFSAPAFLRSVIVGGGFLSDKLYAQATELGWILLPSYGLTECASQVATAVPYYRKLKLLKHINLRLDEKNKIWLKSPALLTCYAYRDETGTPVFHDPKQEGWFETDDIAYLENQFIVIKGRAGDFLKIGGESVDVARLENLFELSKQDLALPYDAAILPVPDNRLGHTIHLATEVHDDLCLELIRRFDQNVQPFEKIRRVHTVKKIPRSDLKKVLKQELLQILF